MGTKKNSLEKYGMEICTGCNSHGYFEKPKRKPCTKFRGLEFIKKGRAQNLKIPMGENNYGRYS